MLCRDEKLSVIQSSMWFRLDYISCALTVASTVMLGRRAWQGWIVAGANSAIICVIAVRTSQMGFIPANVFCLAMYGYNVMKWRATTPGEESPQSGD